MMIVESVCWKQRAMLHKSEPAYYSDSIEPVRRNSSDELFFMIILASPEPGADEYCEAGGAFVSCWVDEDDLRTAERRAVALIREGGWRPKSFDSWDTVSRDTYADWQTNDDVEEGDSYDPRDMVDQAFADGTVCTFHIWPIDAPDAAEDEQPRTHQY